MDGMPHPRRLPGCWRCWRGPRSGAPGCGGAQSKVNICQTHVPAGWAARPCPRPQEGARPLFIYYSCLILGGWHGRGVRPQSPKPPLLPPGLLCHPPSDPPPWLAHANQSSKKGGLWVPSFGGSGHPKCGEPFSLPLYFSWTLLSPTWEVSHHVEGLRAIGLAQHVQTYRVRMGGPQYHHHHPRSKEAGIVTMHHDALCPQFSASG